MTNERVALIYSFSHLFIYLLKSTWQYPNMNRNRTLTSFPKYYLFLWLCLSHCFLMAQTSISNGTCSTAIPIPDNNCVDVSINVATTGNILGQDVFLREVRVIVEHDWRADIEMNLTSPNSDASILLVDRRGSTGDNWGLPIAGNCSQPMILSDEGCATSAITSASREDDPVGRYEPEESFSKLYENTTTNPSGEWNLRVCDQKSQNIGTLEYIELVFEPEGCTAPTTLTTTNITASAVQLDWEDNTTCTSSVIIEYGPTGFTPGNNLSPGSPTSQVVVLNCINSYLLSGLSPVTEYDIYVRQSCAAFSYLYNSCKASILTDCDTPPTTLIEDFDNQINCNADGSCVPCLSLNGVWRNITSDSIDWIVESGKTGSPRTGPEDDVSGGGQYLYIEASFDCANNKEAILLSECININAAIGVCHLSFYYHMLGVDINQLILEGTTDGNNWEQLWTQSGNQDDEWFKVYIDLSAFDNQVMQFRFRGKTPPATVNADGSLSTKPRGDIAIDQIEFYGSQLQITNVLYADKDNDGFGDPNDSISLCFVTQPVGFVTNNQDCDDANAAINPSAQELPCSLIDENCNGDSDDALILNPTVAVNEVCSGNPATIQLNGNPTGTIYWYDSPAGTTPIDSGSTFVTPILMDTTTYYFQEIKDSLGQSCQSGILSVEVAVNQQPDISNASGNQVVCQATDFDLSDLIIQDANDATDTILFYSSDTYAPSSLITPEVAIANNVIYYIQAVGASGCTDELSVSFTIETSPIAQINAADTMAVCFQSSPQLMSVNNLGGGVAPLKYEWNTGTQDDEIIVFSGAKNAFQTYSVTITSANGCSSEDAVVVHTQPSISSIQVVDIQQPGFCQTNGSIRVAPQDGLAPYSYVWNGSSFGFAANSTAPIYTLPNLAMGAYNITVSDSHGCTKSVPQQIVNGPDISIDNVIDVTCNGSSNGAIFVSVGGLINPSFQWIDGTNAVISTDEDLVNVPAGIYNVVIDSDNTLPCPLDSIVINEPLPLEVLNVVTNRPSCAGFGDGSIELTIAGGTPSNSGTYNYAWNNNLPNTNNPTNLSPGFYQTSITDTNGCMITAAGIIESTPLLSISLSGVDPTCVNGDDGQLTVTPTGGTGPYSFQWNDPFQQNTATAFALQSAVYDVTVTDASGCERMGRDTLFQPPGMLVNLQMITPPSCEGVADGIIDLEVTGGTAPYTYSWNNGATSDRITSISDGIYVATITDGNDCTTIVDSILLESPSVMDIAFASVQDPTCIGVNDGMIDIEVSGGIPPYRYAWNSNTGNEDLSNLEAGSYFLTVTDDNNCRSFSDTVTLSAAQAIIVEELITVDILCKGLDGGAAFMNVSSDGGGMAPYTFAWKDSTVITTTSPGFWFSNDFTSLTAGVYELEIKDNLGCTLITSFELTEPEELIIEDLLIEAPTCFGEEDGSVVAVANGGTSPYMYSWTLPNNSVERTDQSFLQDIIGGDYLLQVIDSSGCISAVNTFSIQEPAPIVIDLASSQSVQCSTPNDGILNIAVSGGQMPYNYEWSSGLSSRSIRSLDAGTYTVTTTDAVECTAEETFTVEFEENGLAINLASINEKSCGNANDGAITVAVSGGQGRYQYTWSNGIQSIGNDTMVLNNLGAGTYSVTVVDDNDDFLCRGILEDIVISSGGALRVELDNFNNELACFGENNGSYDIRVIGGAAPYTFLWNDGVTTEDRQDLLSGTYTLTITDANNCSWISGNFFPAITSPSNALQVDSVIVTPALCAGDNTGQIAIAVSGGRQQYDYSWNTGSTTPIIQDLAAGNYALTVTDRNGCTLQWDTTITQLNTALEVELVTQNIDCNSNNLGSVLSNVSCGVPPYSYLWNNGATTSTIENIVAGEYSLTVTDANNAQSIQTVEVQGPSPMQLNGALIDHRNCGGYIRLDIDGGIANSFVYNWRDGDNNPISTDPMLTDLAAGDYFVTVTDANNCSLAAGPFTISIINPIESIESQVDFSAPSALGTVWVKNIIGGTPPFSFLWTDTEGSIVGNDSIVRGLPVGEYVAKVTDANGCEQTTDQLVTSIATIELVESFKIYPNPVKDIALLDATFKETVQIELELIDAVGRSIWRQPIENVQELQHPIPFSTLPTGIFYLKIKINGYPPIGEKILHLKN